MAEESEIRLDRWFKRHFPQVNHGWLEKLLRTGQIRVDGKRVKANVRLETGQTVRIPPLGDQEAVPASGGPPKPKVSRKDAAEIQARVLYKDGDVLVIDKPAGLAVQGGTATPKHLDAMLDALMFEKDERPKLVHRLDKDTSGVLVLARTAFAATKLAAAFRGKDARKYYWAVTVGVPRPFQGKVDAALAKEPTGRGERVAVDDEDGKRAVSLYQVVEHANKKVAFVALWPLTGRTHQLRVHMEAIGTPILGDGKYGGPEAFLAGTGLPNQLHLHARRLIMPHPRGGRIDVTAPLPPHMVTTWTYFSFDKENDGDPFAAVE
ncbi:pseudouridine synthase [Skermanella aerolata]|uniref:Pseudouridine synthase n=2 Tax=Skermanella aerolata TaxID=393310 RepID=A0A512DKR5_9PROT|nr:pseudouridine synthase [Skermanella aerolata]